MVTVKKFGAVWCGPCRALQPVLESLKEEYAGKATIIEYDIDEAHEETEKYGVRSVPTVVIEKDGQEINRFTGLSSKLAYSNAINEALK